MLVCYLPVGSEEAAKYYAQCAIDAKVAFVNCLPVFIASNQEWARKFVDAGVPIVGDDIKSQVGATIVHRVLTKLFEDRGVKLNRTYQLNFGGNMDFMNMLERKRLRLEEDLQDAVGAVAAARSRSRSRRSTSAPPTTCRGSRTASGRRSGWRASPSATCRSTSSSSSRSWDSPNSAGIVIDAVRGGKLALDRGVAGPLIGPSAYFMKSPPVQFSDEAAHEMVEEFILGNGASKHADWTAFFDNAPA